MNISPLSCHTSNNKNPEKAVLYFWLCHSGKSKLKSLNLLLLHLIRDLIWWARGSPRRKLNFLLICASIPIIMLLIRIHWQPCYWVSTWKQQPSPHMLLFPLNTTAAVQGCGFSVAQQLVWWINRIILSWNHDESFCRLCACKLGRNVCSWSM